MKAVYREPRQQMSLSPKGRIRKSSAERKEREKVESALRGLCGTEEGASQLDLVLQAIAYIKELQQQLNSDKENESLDITQLLQSCTASVRRDESDESDLSDTASETSEK